MLINKMMHFNLLEVLQKDYKQNNGNLAAYKYDIIQCMNDRLTTTLQINSENKRKDHIFATSKNPKIVQDIVNPMFQCLPFAVPITNTNAARYTIVGGNV